MGIERFIERLGKPEMTEETSKEGDLKGAKTQVIEPEPGDNPPKKDEVTEIPVSKEQSRKVVDKPNPAPKAPGEEITVLRSRLSELEGKQQLDGKGVGERFNNMDSRVAKLEGIIEANPSIIGAQELVASFEELKRELAEVKEAMEAEIEAAKCPDCRAIVGWDALPAQWYNQMEIKSSDHVPTLLPPMFFQRYGKRCPLCHHFKEVKKEQK